MTKLSFLAAITAIFGSFQAIAEEAAHTVEKSPNGPIGSLIIFGIVYLFIVTEKIEKTTAALLGAAAVVALHYVPYAHALGAVDLNVIFLLVGMMIVMSIMADTGVFEWIAIKIAQKANGNGPLIFLLFMFATAIISAFLDNVTTVILIAPITILLGQILEIRVIPFLIMEAIASNIGGTATLIGDPPNVLIGSQAGLTFNQFIEYLTPPVIIMCVLIFPLMTLVCKKHMIVSADARNRIMRAKPELAILDPVTLKRGLIVFAGIILAFFLHHFVNIEPGIIALTGAIIMSLVCKKDLHHALEKVEWSSVFFFIGLFMLVGSLEYNGIFQELGKMILDVTNGDFMLTLMAILWFSALSSAIVDNIPLVIAMIPLIKSIVPTFAVAQGLDVGADAALIHDTIAMPLYWSLALGACLGGNGTIVGASANVVVTQIARRNNYPITFGLFTFYGFPVMIATLIISTIYLYLRFFW